MARKQKYKICISGAADIEHCSRASLRMASQLGREVARYNGVVVTGATTGVPQYAARAAKKAGGFVIGVSPASSEEAHVKSYRLPVDFHDIIIYTGFGYSGRNLLLTRASDAVVTICGRMGTLNEFTIAFEDQKPQGVLLGSGGMADRAKELIESSGRGPGKVIYDYDPGRLIKRLVVLIEKERKGRLGNRAPLRRKGTRRSARKH